MQLTQSEFLSTVYELRERIEAFTTDNLEGEVQEVIDEINTLKDETEDKLNNMPEQLQYGQTGELLQSRIDELDSWISELESVDLEIDESLSKEEKQEREEEILEELRACDYQGE